MITRIQACQMMPLPELNNATFWSEASSYLLAQSRLGLGRWFASQREGPVLTRSDGLDRGRPAASPRLVQAPAFGRGLPSGGWYWWRAQANRRSKGRRM
jgi:hypothetical protein